MVIKVLRKEKRRPIFLFRGYIKVIGEEIQSTFSWSLFKKAYSIPSAFLYYDNNKFMYVFPKRCFSNNKDIEQLEILAQKSIKAYKITIRVSYL